MEPKTKIWDTGFTRRIDNLGRIVIPKEVREIFKLEEGDRCSFYITKNEIIMKPYDPTANVVYFDD